jgi:uncharacterized membrane protein
MNSVGSVLRRWAVAGLLVWIPLGVTLLVIRFLVGLLDTSLLLIPSPLRPQIPGLGVLLSIVLVFGTGAMAANLFGSKAVAWLEALLQRIPLLGNVYGGMKKLAATLFSGNAKSFRQVVLIEYPRPGIWTIAFQTAAATAEARSKTGQDMVTVFLPTTPNPTSGFILLVPRKDTIPLSMTVEEGMRLVISLGVLTPDQHRAANGGGAAPDRG